MKEVNAMHPRLNKLQVALVYEDDKANRKMKLKFAGDEIYWVDYNDITEL